MNTAGAHESKGWVCQGPARHGVARLGLACQGKSGAGGIHEFTFTNREGDAQ